MLTVNERDELEQMGAANVRAKLVGFGGGRRTPLDGFLQCGDPWRGDVEDWLGEKAKIEAAEHTKMMVATLRWARTAAIISMIGVILIGWIAWRPETYIAAVDHVAAGIAWVIDAARGGLWRH
jgi:hypothetical protein